MWEKRRNLGDSPSPVLISARKSPITVFEIAIAPATLKARRGDRRKVLFSLIVLALCIAAGLIRHLGNEVILPPQE